MRSSMSACTTSIEEPLRSAGKDIRLKCDGVGDMVENRGRSFVGLSVPDPSLIEGCFSNTAFSLPMMLMVPSLASKLFIDCETVAFFSVLINSAGLSTMVMARFSR